MKRAPYYHLLLVLLGFSGQIDSAAAKVAVPVGYVRATNDRHMAPEYVYLAALARSGVRLDNGCLQPWPWTLTVGPVTTHYLTRAEAHGALVAALAQGAGDIKVGLMQVAAPSAGRHRPNELLEPASNLMLGLVNLNPGADSALQALRQRYRRHGLAGFCQRGARAAPVRPKTSKNRLAPGHIAGLVQQLAGQFQVDPALCPVHYGELPQCPAPYTATRELLMDTFDEQGKVLAFYSRPRLNATVAIAVVALVCWLTPGGAKAELTVIYDTGTASPISGFVKAPRLAVPAGLPDINLQAGDGFAAHLFPVHTPELTPGEVNPQATQLLLPQPFFIIGCDTRSRQWLGRYQGRLAQIGAVGLVVEADSLADYQDVSSLANGLRLSPVQGSQLAKQLGISHYPALVSASRIEQ